MDVCMDPFWMVGSRSWFPGGVPRHEVPPGHTILRCLVFVHTRINYLVRARTWSLRQRDKKVSHYLCKLHGKALFVMH